MGNWWSSDEKDALGKLVTQQAKTIRKLEARIEELENAVDVTTFKSNQKKDAPRTYVRRDIIMEWVDKKLEDPDYNITMLPDVIERQLKTQMIELMLETMDFIIENTYTVLPGGHGMFHDIRPLTSATLHD